MKVPMKSREDRRNAVCERVGGRWWRRGVSSVVVAGKNRALLSQTQWQGNLQGLQDITADISQPDPVACCF